MANIISPICFVNANNDSVNNGGDFKVRVFERFVFLFFFNKTQEIEVPLASTRCYRYRVGAPYVFPKDNSAIF